MQRLYSGFPTGRAGVSLVLLRCVVALTLCAHTHAWWAMGSELGIKGMALLVGLCLVLGLLTPYCAALSGLVEVALLISGTGPGKFPCAMAALTAAALIGLGPGAYSIDGRLFGRRVITIPAGRSQQ